MPLHDLEFYSYRIKFTRGGCNYGIKIYDSYFDSKGKFDIELFNGCQIYNNTLEEISMASNKIDPGTQQDARIHNNRIIRVNHRHRDRNARWRILRSTSEMAFSITGPAAIRPT